MSSTSELAHFKNINKIITIPVSKFDKLESIQFRLVDQQSIDNQDNDYKDFKPILTIDRSNDQSFFNNLKSNNNNHI